MKITTESAKAKIGLDHQQYLESKYQELKIQMDELNIQRRISTAVFDEREEQLENQLLSIEKQLRIAEHINESEEESEENV